MRATSRIDHQAPGNLSRSPMRKEFDQEIWIADGPSVAVAGFHYPTRMAVIRLSNGGLFIWSPIELTTSLQADVDGIGQIRHIAAPNSLHHLFLPEWKRAYPAVQMYAPPGLRGLNVRAAATGRAVGAGPGRRDSDRCYGRRRLQLAPPRLHRSLAR
jgi:hypothetical protein